MNSDLHRHPRQKLRIKRRGNTNGLSHHMKRRNLRNVTVTRIRIPIIKLNRNRNVRPSVVSTSLTRFNPVPRTVTHPARDLANHFRLIDFRGGMINIMNQCYGSACLDHHRRLKGHHGGTHRAGIRNTLGRRPSPTRFNFIYRSKRLLSRRGKGLLKNTHCTGRHLTRSF